jgi:hypothetical protein
MKMKFAMILALLSSAGIQNAMAVDSTTQYIYVTNLLDNVSDPYIARTQSAVKIDVYQDGSKPCYTYQNLNFGEQATFRASPTNPACLYMTKLVITPLLKNADKEVYGPITVMIDGAPVTRTQLAIVQASGSASAPVFDAKGILVKPGVGVGIVGKGVV